MPEIATPRSHAQVFAVELAVATAVGAFVGLIGPYGSYLTASTEQRLAYWVGLFWAGSVVFGGAVRLSLWAGRRTGAPQWFMAALALIAGSAAMAAISAAVAVRLWPALASISPLRWFFQVLILSAPLVAGYQLLGRRWLVRPPTRPARAVEEAALWRALPTRLGREVLCLQMEDHYVRVHTPTGSDLALMRLSDAIAAMERPGLRVHRSWWVARAAVSDALREGRRVRLRLTNGLEVPVARNAQTRLRAAGLLDR